LRKIPKLEEIPKIRGKREDLREKESLGRSKKEEMTPKREKMGKRVLGNKGGKMRKNLQKMTKKHVFLVCKIRDFSENG
jgi:hypothetical protein